MPSRVLREGILDSEGVNKLTFPAEVFYRRLMSVVDDFGRFDGRPSILRSRLFALKVDSVREADISRWIAECEKAGLIALYAVDFKPYILFQKLGSPRAKESRYPAPPAGIEAPAVAGVQPHTSAHGCIQPPESVTGSGSGSGTRSSPGSGKSPLPPTGGADGVAIPPEIDTPDFRRAWADWKADRAARRVKPLTQAGEIRQLKHLATFGPAVAIEATETSLRNQWQGIFPERLQPKPAAPPTRGQQQDRYAMDLIRDAMEDDE